MTEQQRTEERAAFVSKHGDPVYYEEDHIDYWLSRMEAREAEIREDERGKMIQNSSGFIETTMMPASAVKVIQNKLRAEIAGEIVAEEKRIRRECWCTPSACTGKCSYSKQEALMVAAAIARGSTK